FTASGVASWPSRSSAASPGSTAVMANTTADTASSEPRPARRRPATSFTMVRFTAFAPYRGSCLEPYVLGEVRAHHAAERDRAQALELLVVAVQAGEEHRN